MTKSRNIMKPRQAWTVEHTEAVRSRYPHERTEDIARDIGRTVSSIYQLAQRLGLNKTKAYFASPAAGRTNGRQGLGTRFAKGLTPWNKGSNFKAGGRSAETRFKPGQNPHNTHPVGGYRLDPDGTLQRKISNDQGNNSKRWRGVHELVWVEANGPVPPKHIVVFRPGMRTAELDEITVDKVECITLAENMRRNTRHNLPKELSEVMQLRGALTRMINKRSKTA
jgi:hypothetical protein